MLLERWPKQLQQHKLDSHSVFNIIFELVNFHITISWIYISKDNILRPGEAVGEQNKIQKKTYNVNL